MQLNKMQIVIVDDNSPDGTWKVVKEISKKNKNTPRFEVRGHLKNMLGVDVLGIPGIDGNIALKISNTTSVSDILKRQDASTAEFHKKSDKIFEEMQLVKNVTNKTAKESSKEMMALLKLSEYQSNIRMNSESKYGDIKDLENMATQTAEIVNLFDRLSIEAEIGRASCRERVLAGV